MRVTAKARHVEKVGPNVERVTTVHEEAGLLHVSSTDSSIRLLVGDFEVVLDVEAARKLRDDLSNIPWVGR